MSQPLPIGGFRWVDDSQQLAKTIAEHPADNPEVDLEYTEDLHDVYNAYRLAPEWFRRIGCQIINTNSLALRLAPTEVEKLVPNLRNKDRYVLHYRNLQLYMSLGIRLTKVHHTLRFDQSPWMEPFIRMNTELQKRATSDLEKDLYTNPKCRMTWQAYMLPGRSQPFRWGWKQSRSLFGRCLGCKSQRAGAWVRGNQHWPFSRWPPNRASWPRWHPGMFSRCGLAGWAPC